jgi:hypothetical protein
MYDKHMDNCGCLSFCDSNEKYFDSKEVCMDKCRINKLDNNLNLIKMIYKSCDNLCDSHISGSSGERWESLFPGGGIGDRQRDCRKKCISHNIDLAENSSTIWYDNIKNNIIPDGCSVDTYGNCIPIDNNPFKEYLTTAKSSCAVTGLLNDGDKKYYESYDGVTNDRQRNNCIGDYIKDLNSFNNRKDKYKQCFTFCRKIHNDYHADAPHYTGNNRRVRDIFNGSDRQDDCVKHCVTYEHGGKTIGSVSNMTSSNSFRKMFIEAKNACPRNNDYNRIASRYSGVDVDTQVKNCMYSYIFNRSLYNKRNDCTNACRDTPKNRWNNNAYDGHGIGTDRSKFYKCFNFCENEYSSNSVNRIKNTIDAKYTSCCNNHGCGIASKREKCRLDRNGKNYYGSGI